MTINQMVWWNGMKDEDGRIGYTPQWVKIVGVAGDDITISLLKDKSNTFRVKKPALSTLTKEWVERYYTKQVWPRGVKFILIEESEGCIGIECDGLTETIGYGNIMRFLACEANTHIMPHEVYKQYYVKKIPADQWSEEERKEILEQHHPPFVFNVIPEKENGK